MKPTKSAHKKRKKKKKEERRRKQDKQLSGSQPATFQSFICFRFDSLLFFSGSIFMADLYGATPSSNPETEEVSTFLNQLLHNSSSSFTQFKAKYIHSFLSQVREFSMPDDNSVVGIDIPVDDRYRVGGSAARAESEPRVNFSDPETYFKANVKDNADNSLSSAGDFSYDSEVKESKLFPF